MKCPKCQSENPEDSKFCLKCGQRFEQICPQCEKSLPMRAKFCNECGQKITLTVQPTVKDLPFDNKLEKIQRYLPKGLTEKILSQRNRIEGERKVVTAMFCDMKGFTPLTEKLGSEETFSLMDQVFEILIYKIHYYGGTVNELMGDGMLAFFGVPITIEDAPQRAIRSALAIHREMVKFNEKLRSGGEIPPVLMRIGINTGQVVIGTIGNDLRVQFTAIGDTINMASRVESMAEPGTTYVTEETFKLAKGFFRFEALGNKEVKGKDKPIQIFRVIDASTRRTRFDVNAETGLTPFVGRERELELLIDGFKRAKDEGGQAVSIISEAGLGKSRLLYEFRKAISNENVTFLEGKCLSYSRGVAYHPVTDILKANFDIEEGDGDSNITQKVKTGLEILSVDETTALPFILELLSVRESGIDHFSMSQEAKADHIFQALKQIAIKGSELRPLIIAVEDLHWIDPSSLELFKNLIHDISGKKVFLIFTYRPEFIPDWRGRSYQHQINLTRLSIRESLAMVKNLLSTRDIQKDLEDLILKKTEGIPFFIEEFLKSLKEMEIIRETKSGYSLVKTDHEMVIPSSIHEVIMARIDKLPERAKDVIQTGSIIEREFSHELLKQVTALEESDLLTCIGAIKEAELIYERGIFPNTVYVFRHALIREIAYASLLSKRKKMLHEKVGRAIEALYKDNLELHFGLLADHYLKSENYKKAVHFSKLAGKKADKTGSIYEAIDYAKKAILCLEALPQTTEFQRQIVDIRTILGLHMIEMNYYAEAYDAIKPIQHIGFSGGYEKRQSQINTIIGACEYNLNEDFQKAFKHLEEAVRRSEINKDYPSLSFASYWIAYAFSLNCEFEKTHHYIEQCSKFLATVNSTRQLSVIKGLDSYFNYFMRGNISQAFVTSQRAMELSKQSGDIFSKMYTYAIHGVACYAKGFFNRAISHLSKGSFLVEKVKHHYWDHAAHHFLGEVNFEVGNFSESEKHFKKAIGKLEIYRYLPTWLSLNKMALARIQVINQDRNINHSSFSDLISNNKVKMFKGWQSKYMAENLLYDTSEDFGEAEKWIKRAIKVDEKNRMMFHLGKDYLVYSKIFKKKNDISKAREMLNHALSIFKKCGAEGWVERYQCELEKL